MKRSELVLLGRITDAHGLKGEVKIASFTQRPEDINGYGPLSTADGGTQIEILSFRLATGGAVIARLSGVSDRTSAEKLRGVELYVPRDALPPPSEEQEYYHSDLIGLSAHSESGDRIGEIVSVHNFGAGDLLEIRLTNSKRTQLIPFDNAHVPEVDLDGRSATIRLPIVANEDGADEAQ